MPPRLRHRAARAAGAMAAAALAACLPEAGPGVGTQLLADRSIAEALLSPGKDAFVVYGRLPPPEELNSDEQPASGSRNYRLRFHATAAAGGLQVPLDLELGASTVSEVRSGGRFGWDPAGRLCVPDGRMPLGDVCLDPRTGAAERFRRRSLDGAVQLLATPNDEDRLLLHDELGNTHDLGPGRGTEVFRGRDLHWIGREPTGEQVLRRFRAGEAQVLATNVNAVMPLGNLPDGPLLIRLDGSDAGRDWHAFDPVRRSRVRLADSGLGNSSQPVASFDGQWVAYTFTELRLGGPPGPVELRAYRLTDGLERRTPVTGAQRRYGADFAPRLWLRPGTHEAWVAFLGQLTAIDLDSGLVRSAEANTDRVETPHVFVDEAEGAYVALARRDANGRRLGVWVVPADDLGAPGVLIENGSDPVRVIHAVTPSTLLVTIAVGDSDRLDAFLVDLASGARRRIAERVVEDPIVAGGRVLLRARGLPTGSGDLWLFDVAAGTEVRLARNVRSLSLQPACPSCGLLAPGARMAYVVNADRPSPQDGLWIATLP